MDGSNLEGAAHAEREEAHLIQRDRRDPAELRAGRAPGADERAVTPYAKNGTPGTAYLRIPSSLISTPMPGFSDTRMNPFSTHGPS